MADFVRRFSLTGKKALITGGSKGIGAAVAEVLADAGADIAIVGRDKAGLAETAQKIQALGRLCTVIEADLATPDQPRQAAEQAMQALGGIDILVNNAGIARIDNLLTLTVEAWDETQAVNLR